MAEDAFEAGQMSPIMLDRGSASFEASLREAPQDEDLFNAIMGLPHGEERCGKAGARLEPRTAPVLRISCRSTSGSRLLRLLPGEVVAAGSTGLTDMRRAVAVDLAAHAQIERLRAGVPRV
jgi:hypothetical protein